MRKIIIFIIVLANGCVDVKVGGVRMGFMGVRMGGVGVRVGGVGVSQKVRGNCVNFTISHKCQSINRGC